MGFGEGLTPATARRCDLGCAVPSGKDLWGGRWQHGGTETQLLGRGAGKCFWGSQRVQAIHNSGC